MLKRGLEIEAEFLGPLDHGFVFAVFSHQRLITGRNYGLYNVGKGAMTILELVTVVVRLILNRQILSPHHKLLRFFLELRQPSFLHHRALFRKRIQELHLLVRDPIGFSGLVGNFLYERADDRCELNCAPVHRHGSILNKVRTSLRRVIEFEHLLAAHIGLDSRVFEIWTL